MAALSKIKANLTPLRSVRNFASLRFVHQELHFDLSFVVDVVKLYIEFEYVFGSTGLEWI